MDLFALLFSVALLGSHATQGSSAVTPVFVLKGNDLLLEADVPEKFSFFSWTFNKKDVLVRFSPNMKPEVTNLYTGRVEATVGNFSVKLKNLNESDSGVYIARVIGDQEQNLAEYKVTVQDPVSPVNLTVDSVSSSSDSCNLTVTCSTQDSHHISISSTFTCDTKTCSQEGGERSKVTTSGASLRVSLLDDLIICNHSNQVSWEKDRRKTRDICSVGPNIANIAIGTTAGLGLVVLCIVVLCIKCRRKNRQKTVYEVPQNISPVQTRNQSPTQDASGVSPNTTYATVTFHTGPDEPTRTKTTNLPETIYAEVNRAAKSNPKSPPQPTPRAGKH